MLGKLVMGAKGMNRTAAIITDEIQHGEEEPSLGWIGVHAFYWVTPRAVKHPNLLWPPDAPQIWLTSCLWLLVIIHFASRLI